MGHPGTGGRPPPVWSSHSQPMYSSRCYGVQRLWSTESTKGYGVQKIMEHKRLGWHRIVECNDMDQYYLDADPDP